MTKVKDHIESITNGNSKRLAYYIATGVVALVLNFTWNVVELVYKNNIENRQIELLEKMNESQIGMRHDIKQVLKEAEKMERYRIMKP